MKNLSTADVCVYLGIALALSFLSMCAYQVIDTQVKANAEQAARHK